MKKIFFSIIAAAAVFTSCNNEVIEQQGHGSLAIDLTCKSDLHEVETKATDEEIINDLVIDIRRPYDNWTVKYDPFSSIRGRVVELGSGDYILTASSRAKEHAAFDQPIYEGNKDFKILTGQVTTVDVICSITNAKVTVNLSSNFVNELAHYTVTVSNGSGILVWNKNAQEDDFKPVVVDGKTYFTGNQAGFFTVAPLSIVIDGHRAIDNTSASAKLDILEVNPADHHILNIDAKVTGQLGDVDESGNVIKEPIKITISHEVNPVDQTIVVPGFTETPVPGDDPSQEGGDDTGDNGDNGGNGGDNSGEGGDNSGNEGGSTGESPITISWAANPTLEPVDISNDLDATLIIDTPSPITEFTVVAMSQTEDFNLAVQDMICIEENQPLQKMDMINDTGMFEQLAVFGVNLPTGDDIKGQTNVSFSITQFLVLINSMFQPASKAEHYFTLYVADEAGNTIEKTLVFITRY